MVDVAILIVSVVVSLATGLFVFFRNPRQNVNRIYGLLTLSLILFSTANFFSLRTDDRLFYIRAVIFFSTLIVASLYYLVVSMDENGRRLSDLQRWGIITTLCIAVLDFTPFVFSGLTDGVNPVPTPGAAAILFAAHLLIFLTVGIGALIGRFRNSQGQRRLQYMYMLIGMLPIFLFAPLTGFVMPVILQNTSLVLLSPIYGAIFVCSIGYAIVRHRLFDVRFVVARSLAYALSLTVIASIYGFVVFGISQVVFDLNLSLTLQIALSVSTGVAVLVFSRFKTYFDTATNKLFYRDAYDPQDLFDEYNRTLVSTIDLTVMLRKTSTVVTKYLQSEFCVIGVKDGSDKEFRIEGTAKVDFDLRDIEFVRSLTPHMHSAVILVDDIPVEKAGLRKVLQKYDIALLVRLTTDTQKVQEGIGYLALGPKKSGNQYNRQDVKVIEALANELIIALQNALRFEEIERFNQTLQAEIEQATRKLRQSNLKLKKLDQTKDDFISMTSHQLRTPLSSIKGYVSLVMEGDAGEVTETQRKLLAQAFGSAQKMVYLVADLLNVSRLKTGKFVIERVPSDLSKVVTDEIAQLKEEFSARDLTVEYAQPKAFPVLPLDETKTRQVIMNFLDNAIYYTPKGGHVKVELEELPDRVEFRVIDNGIGVPKSERPHLFGKFYRAKNAQRARPDGTGLGLYMASKVVIAQGGAIIFESKEGQGSTFGFRFPKDMPEGQVPFPAQSHDE